MYLLRYTPQAMRDMDSVWDEVYQASKSYDIADKYIKDFIDTITEKKSNFRHRVYHSDIKAYLRDFIL